MATVLHIYLWNQNRFVRVVVSQKHTTASGSRFQSAIGHGKNDGGWWLC